MACKHVETEHLKRKKIFDTNSILFADYHYKQYLKVEMLKDEITQEIIKLMLYINFEQTLFLYNGNSHRKSCRAIFDV